MQFTDAQAARVRERISEELGKGTLNAWEQEFLTDMQARFDLYGKRARLSKRQFGTLVKLTGPISTDHHRLDTSSQSEASQSSYRRTYSSKSLSPLRVVTSPQRDLRRAIRPFSPFRALYAPQRAVRRATRQLIWPIFIIFGVLSLVGTAFNTSGSRSYDEVQSLRSSEFVEFSVIGETVNQRDGPSTSNAVIGQLTKGTRVRKLSEQGGWTQITSALGSGWMSSRYLQPIGSANPRPTNSSRNTRTLSAAAVSVIDGDTVHISGGAANVRLVGFNTPEISSPKCRAEYDLGMAAKRRLGQLLQQADLIVFELIACSCTPGTAGTSRCNYGRDCGNLVVDGQNVGSILIAEQLAVQYLCGRTSCPPRPGNWCR